MQDMGLGGAPGPGGRPTVRNAMMATVIPWGLIVGGNVIGAVLASLTEMGLFVGVGSLMSLVGSVLLLLGIIKMTNELKAVTGNVSFAWWPLFIPFYNYYWMWIMVPAEVNKAKQMRGVQQPARGFFMYFFPVLFPYALAADLNDIAKAP